MQDSIFFRSLIFIGGKLQSVTLVLKAEETAFGKIMHLHNAKLSIFFNRSHDQFYALKSLHYYVLDY